MGRDRKLPTNAVDDPSIYAYDEVYDSMKAAEKRARAALDPHGKSRQPRYINSLLKVAESRRNEQALIKERKIQRERETEGDQFADKETFFTSAYKKQKEDADRLAERESQAEAEDHVNRQKGDGQFFRQLMHQTTSPHDAMVRAGMDGHSSTLLPTVNAPSPTRSEMPAVPASVTVNDDQQIVDKRELLAAGLNIMSQRHPKPASSLASSRQASIFTRAPLSKHHSGRTTRPSRFTDTNSSQPRSVTVRHSHHEDNRPLPKLDIQQQLKQTRAQLQEQESSRTKALLASLARRNDEASIAAARERYFARRALNQA